MKIWEATYQRCLKLEGEAEKISISMHYDKFEGFLEHGVLKRHAALAQSVERRSRKAKAMSSILMGGSNNQNFCALCSVKFNSQNRVPLIKL
jgi:hypothetical protein